MVEHPSGYFDNPRTELLDYVPRDVKRILEIGCGSGSFANGLRAVLGAEVEYWGIEQNHEAAKRASSVLTRVLCSSIEEALASLPDGHFDLVICNDVLEHLIDPERCMRDIRVKLASGAYWFASIPNIRFLPILVELLIFKDWRYKDSGVLDRTHLRFFTEKSLRRFALNCGFQLNLLMGINSRANFVFRIFNLLTFGFFADTQFPQYILIARNEMN